MIAINNHNIIKFTNWAHLNCPPALVIKIIRSNLDTHKQNKRKVSVAEILR